MTTAFEQLTLASGLTLKNRVFMAPMTTQSADENGFVNDELVTYYRERAKDVGAIVVECGYVQRNGMAFPGGVGLSTDDHIAGLAKIAEAIKQQGSVPIMQIYHGGRMVRPELLPDGSVAIAPSAIAACRHGCVEPKALTVDEIEQLIVDFGLATERAIKAGFAGVEIHGANTYLIQQFFSPHSNRRDDQWGGDIEKRARFPLAIVDVVKSTVKKCLGDKPFVVGYRFSPEELEKPGINYDDTLFLLEKLAHKGLDYLHFSTGQAVQTSIIDLHDKQPLIDKLIQNRSETLAKIPVMGVGSIKQAKDLDNAFAHGFDLVSVGKALIVEPRWLQKVQDGEEVLNFMHIEDCKARHVPETVWDIIGPSMEKEEKSYLNKQAPRKEFVPGTYVERFADFHGMVHVEVTLDRVSIQKIDVTGKSLAPGVTIDAFTEMARRIKEKDGTDDVDVVSGATESCQSVLEAVDRIIAKATGTKMSKNKLPELPWLPDELSVDESQIEENIETDVVIVGCGVAGTCAVRAAAEEGAKVVVIEKADSPQCRSGEYAIINGKVQARWGRDNFNVDEMVDRFMRECSYRIKRPIVSRWAKNCADVFDWFISAKPDMWICETQRSPVPDEHADFFLEPMEHPLPPHYNYKNEDYPTYPTSVHFVPSQAPMINANFQKALDTGNVDARFGHFVEKLLKDGDKVTGVIARNAATGKYVRIIAKRGVVLATGDYGSNKKMVDHYCPEISESGVKNIWLNRDVEGNLTNTGDGHKLGAQIGARIQQHHAPMTHNMGGPFGMAGGLGNNPFLFLNKHGKRFMNEEVPGQQLENQIEMQPDNICYQLFDNQWREQLAYMPAAHGTVSYYDNDEVKNHPKCSLSHIGDKEFQHEVDEGNVLVADTLPELLAQLDIDQETALKSIERYNQLAQAGYDEDFAKSPSRLFAINQGPFYAVRFVTTTMLTCLGGLESDEDSHTYDVDRNVIKGLYVAGNVQGNRVAVEYPICMKGVSHSMAMFYGYIAGKNCANQI
ncbi:FAD-binding protein [Lonepinella koalarum]|uniref:FAD-dependent oxidoreductase n=1 Tax=Lonepinella koalarum TaxID=53417 RepID=UPI0011E3E0C4|nr:FAD-dependent oxidoreductase [Lonepinella koalarum]TYG34330.1 FAD-binding protein [Lonepinella koalarum]